MIHYPDGTVFIPDRFNWGWVDVISDVIAYASPELREAIQKEVQKRVSREDESKSIYGHCDASRAADLGEKWNGWGKSYLYIWLDGEGIPFYVGKAEDPSRMGQYAYKTRSEEFQNIIRKGGCHAVMVAKHIPGDRIDELERNLISYMCWREFPLVNVKDMPSKEKTILWSVFKACKNTADVQSRLGVGATDVYLEWKADMAALAPVIEVIDEVIGVKWDGACADLSPKEKVPPQTFTYNGVTKTWGEWGKAIGVGGGTIKNRIENLGWPIEKALSEPSAQAKSVEERKERLKKRREQEKLLTAETGYN